MCWFFNCAVGKNQVLHDSLPLTIKGNTNHALPGSLMDLNSTVQTPHPTDQGPRTWPMLMNRQTNTTENRTFPRSFFVVGNKKSFMQKEFIWTESTAQKFLVLCKILCLHVLIFAALLIKGLAVKAVVELCLLWMWSCIEAAVVSLDLGFDVKSCNWCEAALQARINLIKVSTLLLLFTQIYFIIWQLKYSE